MASTTLSQLVVKNAAFKAALGTGTLAEFGDHIDQAALNTTAVTATFGAISGNAAASVGDMSETITLNLAQSLKTGSLWLFLRANHGKAGKVEFMPQGGTAPKVAADVIFQAPGVLGGAAGGGVTGATLLVTGTAVITPEA